MSLLNAAGVLAILLVAWAVSLYDPHHRAHRAERRRLIEADRAADEAARKHWASINRLRTAAAASAAQAEEDADTDLMTRAFGLQLDAEEMAGRALNKGMQGPKRGRR